MTPNILYAARRACRATPRPQMMISVWPPPYLEKSKCVSNTNNSTIASCWHVDTRRIIESLRELMCALSTQRCCPIYQPTVFWSETIETSPGPPGREECEW